MKIQFRLMLAIIPVMVAVHLCTSLFTSFLSTGNLEKRARENAQQLSYIYSQQLDSRITNYLNITQDLGSAAITAIHIETALQAFKKRYPQFTHIIYTPVNGKILDAVPYKKETIGMDLGKMKAWQKAFRSRKPAMSEPGIYFGKKSVIYFAPAILSYVLHQQPTVEGMVAIVLPLENLFKNMHHLMPGDSGSIFVIDSHGVFLRHRNAGWVLSEKVGILSSTQPMQAISESMISMQKGFATYHNEQGRQFISFAPVPAARWSLGVQGTYSKITSEITEISIINAMAILAGIIIGTIVIYLVVHSVVRPIERLTSIAEKIAAGDRNVTVDIKTGSEVGKLSQSINAMVTELRDYHKKLEDKVEERTIALKKTNRELNQTIRELNTANRELENARNNLEFTVSERTMQLQKALNYIDNIINSMPSVLIGVDSSGTVTQWNNEAEKLTGLSRNTAIGSPLKASMPDIAIDMENIRKTVKTKKEYTDSRRPVNKSNKTRYKDITVYPLIANGVDGAVIRIDDITTRVEMEEALLQSQKLDAIGLLAGGIAHDFNNMLGGILGASQLLKRKQDDLNEKQMKYIDLIIKSSNRAADLTQKLLTFSRKGGVDSKAVDMHNVIDDVVSIFKRTLNKKIKLKVIENAKKHIVSGDSTALQNVLMNLGINSSHAMPDGGQLEIITDNIVLSPVFCDASPFKIHEGEYIHIKLSDNGIGIPPENLNKIFEPFFTTREHNDGTGLGLSAVYGTVQNHNGAIEVYSEPGTGTVFNIYLPCSGKPQVKKRVDEEIVSGQGTILLVDDEEILRIVGQNMLENMGYTVITAENGKEGLEIFKEEHHRIDLVIMDMMMPKMNGKEAFFQMKSIDKHSKIVLTSGFTQTETLEEMRVSGLSGFLSKPLTDSTLSRMVARVLSQTVS